MKTNQKSKGLGDTIAKFTKITRLDKFAKKIANFFGEEDCGCERRRDKLNKIIPYKDKE